MVNNCFGNRPGTAASISSAQANTKIRPQRRVAQDLHVILIRGIVHDSIDGYAVDEPVARQQVQIAICFATDKSKHQKVGIHPTPNEELSGT